MSTSAIIGAGPGLGAATARAFGQRDFIVALISRSQANLDRLATDLAAATRFSILGPAAAVQHVLPAMTDLGHGTILLVNGSSAVTPNGNVAGTSIAFAGESAYAAMLHEALTPKNIHVGLTIEPEKQ
jgi:short-subunit dehydrogenase